MKALVTGANGFLGSHIVEALVEQGYSVTALTRRREGVAGGPLVKHVLGDIRNQEGLVEAFAGHDVVFHTAAISGIWGPWKQFHGVNTIGTRNVIQACLANQVKKLVYTSSPSVTFDGNHQMDTDESAPYPKKWLCHYPRSKALAEQSVLESNDDAELMTCALRPHLIWGPRDRHLIPRLIERAKSKQLRRVGDGSNRVDNIYVENAAAAHIQAAQAMKPGAAVCGRAYFISQDDPVNLWGWINDVLELVGLPRVRRSISYKAAYRIGYAMEMFYEMTNKTTEPRMTRFLAAQLAKSHFFDISNAKRDFGYKPKVSNEEGMKRLAAYLNA